MIFLGYSDGEKRAEIASYGAAHAIERIIVISADDFPLVIEGADQVRYSDVIMYVTFYRLLQEITPATLIVLNECLRTQNRYDLAYNCIRNYLNLTNHQLIFQQLPQIDTHDDFMILFDWDTHSRWKRMAFDPSLIRGESQVQMKALPIGFERIDVPTSNRTKACYQVERDKLFRELGNRDPHIIPRQLYMIGGKDKRAIIDCERDYYVARNKRLGRECIITYGEAAAGKEYVLVELPHRFIDYVDFMQRTGQTRSQVLVADLPVDRWYWERYQEWSGRIHDTYAALS